MPATLNCFINTVIKLRDEFNRPEFGLINADGRFSGGHSQPRSQIGQPRHGFLGNVAARGINQFVC